MNVWISIGYSVGEPKRHETVVSEEQLIKAAHDHYWSLKNRPKHKQWATSTQFGNEFIKKLLGLENIQGTAVTYNMEPKFITVYEIGMSWFCIHWIREIKIAGEEKCGMAFMYRSNGKWDYFPIPTGCILDPGDGDLTIRSYKGNELFYPAFVEPWPEPMKAPYAAPSLGILNRLLKAEDENPLTMLACAGHQPCKGAAKQVINAMKIARDLLIHDPVER